MSADTTDVAPETKTAEKSAPGRPFTKGDPRAGVGKKGRSGRPKLAFADACKELQRGVVLRKVTKLLNDKTVDPNSAAFQWATNWISKYGERETAKRFEHGGLDGNPIAMELVSAASTARAKLSKLAGAHADG